MKKLALSLLLIGVLSACQPQKEEVATVACDSDVVKSTFDLGTKQQIMAKLKYLAQAQPEVYGSLNFSQIEQALDSIQFNLESIHTESKPTDTPQFGRRSLSSGNGPRQQRLLPIRSEIPSER